MNVLPLTMFCHALLPDMARRGRGAVINISSVAGLVPVPHLAVYSATQHYISALTQAIAQEYSGQGVVIQEVSCTPSHLTECHDVTESSHRVS